MEEETRSHNPVGYMCTIDFECELGRAKGGNVIYPSIEDLKANHDCWEECGIVEVEVALRWTIHEGSLELPEPHQPTDGERQ